MCINYGCMYLSLSISFSLCFSRQYLPLFFAVAVVSCVTVSFVYRVSPSRSCNTSFLTWNRDHGIIFNGHTSTPSLSLSVSRLSCVELLSLSLVQLVRWCSNNNARVDWFMTHSFKGICSLFAQTETYKIRI